MVNLYNPAADRGPSSYDQPFNDTLSIIADLPFGKGRMFGQGAPAWQQAILGGWQACGDQCGHKRSADQPDLRSNLSGCGLERQRSVCGTAEPGQHSEGGVRAEIELGKTGSQHLTGTLLASQVTVPTPSQYFGNCGTQRA